MFRAPEKFRVRSGPFGSSEEQGVNGFFRIGQLTVIASNGGGWEHVSVSLKDRMPTWDNMCFVKSLFWDDEDCVIQFHPPKSSYVNNHRYCLHLWRPVGQEIPRPPDIMVGYKELGVLD